jgi:ABC-2 type transport system ATP-binding protein
VSEAAAEQAAEPVLRVAGLGKQFGARTALHGVSFELRAGELVAAVGPNGAGKTTLLSILAGVQGASSGTVSGRAAAGGAREIGWAPQQAAVYGRLTVRENLRLFARLEQVSDADAAVARMLEQTGLQPRADDRVESLSGGNRQRVNVALALLADPLVLALDEPTSALDPAQRARLWGFVSSLAGRGKSVLFSTHHLGEVRRYASRAIVLVEGEVLFDGSPRELLGGDRGEGEEQDDAEGVFLRFLADRGGG